MWEVRAGRPEGDVSVGWKDVRGTGGAGSADHFIPVCGGAGRQQVLEASVHLMVMAMKAMMMISFDFTWT